VREFNAENLRLRDQVQPNMTPLEALIKLESGETKSEIRQIELESEND